MLPAAAQLRRRRERAPGFVLLIYLVRSAGNAGLALPIRTLPLSLVSTSLPRTGGNAGLELPIRTRPPSEMTVGLSFALTWPSFALTIGSSMCRLAILLRRYT
jgi:hypothetical protein